MTLATHATLFALAVGATGCAFALTGSTAPTIDTARQPGAETRVEGMAAAGTDVQGYVALAAGGGYRAREGTGYALIAPEIGAHFGDQWMTGVGALYAARVVFTHPAAVRHAGGLAVQFLPRVSRTGGEHGALRVGPRFGAELEGGRDAALAGVFSLALVVRWVAFDTTRNHW